MHEGQTGSTIVSYILFADDDPLMGVLVHHKLKKAGHEIEHVLDGEAALAAIAANQPDLVILDAMMPVLSGPEVLNRLKQDEATRRIPVIMLTARKAEADVMGALQNGADDYITKPFLPDEFTLRISRVLESRAH